MGVLEKLRKRQNYPVTLPNGEVIRIRTPSFGEQIRGDEVRVVNGPAFVGFMIGSVLVEDGGGLVYTKNQVTTDDADATKTRLETDAEFGMRVARESEIDTPTFQAIQEAIKKLDKVPSIDVLKKTSDETSTP